MDSLLNKAHIQIHENMTSNGSLHAGEYFMLLLPFADFFQKEMSLKLNYNRNIPNLDDKERCVVTMATNDWLINNLLLYRKQKQSTVNVRKF